jgi:hypothetical protein
MKKVIKLTESDLERIVRRVIEEQYAGVSFGAEQNGLRIKKVEAAEQVSANPVVGKTPTTMTPSKAQVKPTFEMNSVAYYVPGLDDSKLNQFTAILPYNFLAKLSPTQLRSYFEKNIGVKSPLGGPDNPFGAPDVTFEKEARNPPFPNYVTNFYGLKDSLENAMLAYLKYWRPNLKGLDVIKNSSFLSDPAVKTAKNFISNFDEVMAKALPLASRSSGLNVA